jgi:hypothetical protein
MRQANGRPLLSFYPFLKTIPATGHSWSVFQNSDILGHPKETIPLSGTMGNSMVRRAGHIHFIS